MVRAIVIAPSASDRVRSASASYIGTSSGATLVEGRQMASTVASSPRAIGPVSASPPRSAQLAAVRSTSGASSSRASSTPARDSSSAADSSSATRKLDAIDAAAW